MYLVNKTGTTITLTEVINGNDLVIPGNGKTEEIGIYSKDLLRKILLNASKLEVHVTRGTEINAIDEIDPRLTTLLILD